MLLHEDTYDDVELAVDFRTDARVLEYDYNLYLQGGGAHHPRGQRHGQRPHAHRQPQCADANAVWNYELIDCRYGVCNEEDDGYDSYEHQAGSCADVRDSLRRDTGTAASCNTRSARSRTTRTITTRSSAATSTTSPTSASTSTRSDFMRCEGFNFLPSR